MTSERLAEIREHFTGWIPVDDISNVRYAQDLLAHVDHLTADNARLREGIERVRGHVYEAWLNHGDTEAVQAALYDCDALLNPPTEGES